MTTSQSLAAALERIATPQPHDGPMVQNLRQIARDALAQHRANTEAAGTPEPDSAALDAIADAHRWDTRDGRRLMLRTYGDQRAALARREAEDDARDAARYRALRNHQFTYSPRITDPANEWLTYTPEGLDAVCDEMVAAIRALAPDTSKEG